MFDLKRIITGLFIILSVFGCYYFNFDIYFIAFLFFLTITDLYISKIINSKSNYFFLASIIIFSIYFLYLDNLIFIFLLLFLLITLTLLNQSNLNTYFTSVVLILFALLIGLNSLSRSSFYLIFLLSFINDTSALIIGKTIKGPHIVPKISPNKTWSGTLISLIISFVILIYLNFSIIFSFILSLSFFISDIYFSFVKRKNDLKDFSKILNKHGGILDRLDSILIPSSLLLFNYCFL